MKHLKIHDRQNTAKWYKSTHIANIREQTTLPKPTGCRPRPSSYMLLNYIQTMSLSALTTLMNFPLFPSRCAIENLSAIFTSPRNLDINLLTLLIIRFRYFDKNVRQIVCVITN